MLGRGGVLVLNGVAAISQLPEIEQDTPKILAAIDFNPKSDKIAGYMGWQRSSPARLQLLR